MAFLMARREKPEENMWVKCPGCGEVGFKKDLGRNLKVCPACSYHFRMNAKERIEQLIDPGTFQEMDVAILSRDPLRFKDSKSYRARLKESRKKTGHAEALVSGVGLLSGVRVSLAVFEFGFLGGSMGAVVGEKLLKAMLRAKEERIPLVTVSASGGARMHEGAISLMQMARTISGRLLLSKEGVPFLSIMTDPTTGGVAASFAFLGDVILAEPGALIGFAGPRVIEETVKQKLPEGFQRAEFLLAKGMIDGVVPRAELKKKVATFLYHLWPPAKEACMKKWAKRPKEGASVAGNGGT